VSANPLKVSLKYCGSCNPLIDLVQIGNELKGAISEEPGLSLVSPDSSEIDVMLILCGCPRTCGNKEEVRSRASNYIVVGGESIDQVTVREKAIVNTVISRLKSMSQD
jgi:hypothetical protein